MNVAAHPRARQRVAANVVRLMNKQKRLKKELAVAAKMSRNTLDRILNADAGITIDSLGRLADALDVDIADLLADQRA